jgi:hypothetical protein
MLLDQARQFNGDELMQAVAKWENTYILSH